MVNHILILSKVVGTVSLGILAGSTITTSYVVLPGLQQATDGGVVGASILNTVYSKTSQFIHTVSISAFLALTSAFIFAAPNARHPYLLYSALSVPIVGAISYFGSNIPLYDKQHHELHFGSGGRPLASTKDDVSSNSSISLEDLSSVDSNNNVAGADRQGSVEERAEPSMLGDSVYAHVLSDAGSDSDSKPIPPSNEASTVIAAQTTSQNTHHHVPTASDFKREYLNLRKFSVVSAAVYSVAFAISTVGIYGDLA